MKQMQPVILAGGSGSRLWPLSRDEYPKQLLNLTGGRSLLQNTLERVAGFSGAYPPIVVVRKEHRYQARKQIDELGLFPEYAIVLEPLGRDTGPALTGTVEYIRRRRGDDTFVLVMPSDHMIESEEGFVDGIQRAFGRAARGEIVTFGIQPGWPETGYGYIEAREDGTVATFKEKPQIELARLYLQRENYYWNSGIFAFFCQAFRREIKRHALPLHQCMVRAVENGIVEDGFFCFHPDEMSPVEKISIDYALMEKTTCASVVPVDISWRDIGTWQALWSAIEGDKDGNVCQGEVVTERTTNSLVSAQDRLVAVLGLDGAVVVETADAVLVSSMAETQAVKNVVERLRNQGREETHRRLIIVESWGEARILLSQPGYQIRRLRIKPGAGTSLQKHYHRSENWVVVKGTARVTSGKESFLLQEQQSASVPSGVVHRLENPGVVELEIIEMQTGAYLGIDDVLRYEDGYGPGSKT